MERSTHTTVHFQNPFRLPDVDGVQPPGAYEVETLEEQIEGLSFAAFRRISTTILLRHPTSSAEQVTMVDPSDLSAALERDVAETQTAV